MHLLSNFETLNRANIYANSPNYPKGTNQRLVSLNEDKQKCTRHPTTASQQTNLQITSKCSYFIRLMLNVCSFLLSFMPDLFPFTYIADRASPSTVIKAPFEYMYSIDVLKRKQFSIPPIVAGEGLPTAGYIYYTPLLYIGHLLSAASF